MRSRPPISSAQTVRAARSGRSSGSSCADPTTCSRASRHESGRRSGRRSAISATASTPSTTPRRRACSCPPAPATRWGYGYLVDPSVRDPELPSREQLVDRIRLAAGIPDLPVVIERLGSFSSAAQLADRFRHDQVFLVGDAAHRVTPRGGTGMNTAVHDGYDIGWKLAWVMNGWASPALLDSYELERRPVAAHNVARSADPDGTVRAAEEELRVDLGGRIAHHRVTTPGRPRVDPRPARPRADAPHGTGRRVALGRAGGVIPAAGRGARPRRDHRPRHGHRKRRRPARSPRRDPGGVVAGRRREPAGGARCGDRRSLLGRGRRGRPRTRPR